MENFFSPRSTNIAKQAQDAAQIEIIVCEFKDTYSRVKGNLIPFKFLPKNS